MISGVSSEHVDLIWHLARKHIESATKYSDDKYLPEDVHKACLSGEMQLWVILDGTELVGAGATSIHEYPRKRVCVAMFCASDQQIDWSSEFQVIEDWARSRGCEGTEIIGRPGWEKVMKDYRKIHVVLGKSL